MTVLEAARQVGITTLWGLPPLHSKSRSERPDKTRFFLPLPGGKKFDRKN